MKNNQQGQFYLTLSMLLYHFIMGFFQVCDPRLDFFISSNKNSVNWLDQRKSCRRNYYQCVKDVTLGQQCAGIWIKLTRLDSLLWFTSCILQQNYRLWLVLRVPICHIIGVRTCGYPIWTFYNWIPVIGYPCDLLKSIIHTIMALLERLPTVFKLMESATDSFTQKKFSKDFLKFVFNTV